jgi:hypothetical protein
MSPGRARRPRPRRTSMGRSKGEEDPARPWAESPQVLRGDVRRGLYPKQRDAASPDVPDSNLKKIRIEVAIPLDPRLDLQEKKGVRSPHGPFFGPTTTRTSRGGSTWNTPTVRPGRAFVGGGRLEALSRALDRGRRKGIPSKIALVIPRFPCSLGASPATFRRRRR